MTAPLPGFEPPQYLSLEVPSFVTVCTYCGAAVWNMNQHTEWHAELWVALSRDTPQDQS